MFEYNKKNVSYARNTAIFYINKYINFQNSYLIQMNFINHLCKLTPNWNYNIHKTLNLNKNAIITGKNITPNQSVFSPEPEQYIRPLLKHKFIHGYNISFYLHNLYNIIWWDTTFDDPDYSDIQFSWNAERFGFRIIESDDAVIHVNHPNTIYKIFHYGKCFNTFQNMI